jgi:nucleoside-diphosphate-sugar epimerase
MRLLLLGATGLVGSTALKQALAKDAISEVVAPTRRSLAQNKLVNPVNLRLDELAPQVKSWNVDAVVCALGTTKVKAGSQEAFRYVDYSLPLVFAKAAHGAGVETFALVSAIGAATNSMFSYARTKGEVERHSADRLPLPHHLPPQHHWWREKGIEDSRGRRFGYLASVSTHLAEKVSRQSGRCHCGILARFSSRAESRLPLDLC